MSLVSGSQDKTMKVWELPSAEKLREAVTASGSELSVKKAKVTVVAHSKEVNDVSISPNNKLMASGGHDKLVRIWKYPTAELLGDCKGHRRGIWCVVFSPCDQVVASASGDTTVRLWNLKDFTAIRAFEGHSSAVLRVCFLGGMQLMSTGVDGLVKLWQIRTAECAATFEEHLGKVWCIDVLGERMVSGGTDSKLCVWRDVTKEREKERHDAHAEAAVKDSKIGVLLREGKIDKALTLALDLARPGQMRSILQNHAMDIVGESIEKNSRAMADPDKELPAAEDGDKELDLHKWLLSLTSAQLERLVDVAEQWNTNRKMAPIAQMLLGAMLRILPPTRLTAVEGMNATCATVLSYSSRHMARVDALLQKTFLFDLALQASGQGLAMLDDALGGSKAKRKEDFGEVDGAVAALERTMDVLLGDVPEEEAEAAASDSDGGEADAAPTNGANGVEAANGQKRSAQEEGGSQKKRKKKGKA